MIGFLLNCKAQCSYWIQLTAQEDLWKEIRRYLWYVLLFIEILHSVPACKIFPLSIQMVIILLSYIKVIRMMMPLHVSKFIQIAGYKLLNLYSSKSLCFQLHSVTKDDPILS